MPGVKITGKQWKRLLERLMLRENVPPSIEEAKFLLNKYNPPPSETFAKYLENVAPESTGEYGRLIDYNQKIGAGVKGGSVYKGHMLPIEEARQKVLSEPDRYGTMPAIPPVNRLSFQAPPGAPGELAEGVAYERMKFKGLSDVENVKKRAGQLMPEMRSEGAISPEEGLSPLVQLVAQADDAWRALGGKRGYVYRAWDTYWKASKIKGMYSEPKSYFVGQYIRWSTQKDFAKRFPKESAYFEAQVKAGKIGPAAAMGIGAGAVGMEQEPAPAELPPIEVPR